MGDMYDPHLSSNAFTFGYRLSRHAFSRGVYTPVSLRACKGNNYALNVCAPSTHLDLGASLD